MTTGTTTCYKVKCPVTTCKRHTREPWTSPLPWAIDDHEDRWAPIVRHFSDVHYNDVNDVEKKSAELIHPACMTRENRIWCVDNQECHEWDQHEPPQDFVQPAAAPAGAVSAPGDLVSLCNAAAEAIAALSSAVRSHAHEDERRFVCSACSGDQQNTYIAPRARSRSRRRRYKVDYKN